MFASRCLLTNKTENYVPNFKDKFSYEEILGKEFVWYPNDYVYTKNSTKEELQQVPFDYHHLVPEKNSWEIDAESKDYSKGIKMNQ